MISVLLYERTDVALGQKQSLYPAFVRSVTQEDEALVRFYAETINRLRGEGAEEVIFSQDYALWRMTNPSPQEMAERHIDFYSQPEKWRWKDNRAAQPVGPLDETTYFGPMNTLIPR